jgi:superfamily II DNA or RNA helicase
MKLFPEIIPTLNLDNYQHQNDAIKAMSIYRLGKIILPTGAGKTVIQLAAIFNDIEKRHEDRRLPGVYVIAAPQIMLTNQLFNDIFGRARSATYNVAGLVVHSGKTPNLETEKIEINGELQATWTRVRSTTTSIDLDNPERVTVRQQYDLAKQNNQPLIIFSTYDSLWRVQLAGIDKTMLLCDEAHHVVSQDNQWIKYNTAAEAVTIDSEGHRRFFQAEKKFFFTATPRLGLFTKRRGLSYGQGMENEKYFGKDIINKTPMDMIVAGVILKPRLHIVNVNPEIDPTRTTAYNAEQVLITTIIESYVEHQEEIRKHSLSRDTGAKLLSVMVDRTALNTVVKDRRFQAFCEAEGIKVFDITAGYGARINGKAVDRVAFIKELKNLKDYEKAIVLHVQILREGIDVSSFTGVLFTANVEIIEFLQNLGRATRLNPVDRKNLRNGIINFNEPEKFNKPYAWVIVPQYPDNSTITDFIVQTVTNMREGGFDPSAELVISPISVHTKGEDREQDEDTRLLVRDTQLIVDHDIETTEEAEELSLERYEINNEVQRLLDNTVDEEDLFSIF